MKSSRHNIHHSSLLSSSKGNPLLNARANTLGTLTILFILASVVALTIGFYVSEPWTRMLATANILVCAFGLIFSLRDGAKPVAIVFYIFTISWLGIAPVYQIASGTAAWGDHDVVSQSSNLVLALFLNLTMSCSFTVGNLLVRSNKELDQSNLFFVVRNSALYMWVLVLAALSPFIVAANGGIGTFFSSRVGRSAALAAAGLGEGGIGYALTRIMPAALSVVIAHLLIARIKERRHYYGGFNLLVSNLPLILISAAYLVLYCNPMSNSRFISIVAFGSILIAVARPTTKVGGWLLALITAFATFVVYPLANIFRTDASGQSLVTGLQAFARSDFDGFQQVINTVAFVDASGHSLGKYMLSSTAFFVPRSLWPDKALPASIDVAAASGYWFTDLSLPIHAEMYLEFGWVGVVVGMITLGFFAGKLDRAWAEPRFSRLQFLAPYMAVAMLGVVRGPLGSLIPIYLTTVALLFWSVRKTVNDDRAEGGVTPSM